MRSYFAFPLALTLVPGHVLADLAPQDVWDNLSAAYSAAGFEITGTPVADGDGLTIADGTLQVIYPVGTGKATLTLPRMTLTDQGDGTVAVVTPQTYAVEVTADMPDASGLFTASVTISQADSSTVASGTPGDITYSTAASGFDMLVTDVNLPGEEFDFTFELQSDGYLAETRVTDNGTVTIASAIQNNAATTDMTITTGQTRQESQTSGGTVLTNATVVLPPDMNIMNLTPALAAGLSAQIELSAESSTSSSRTFDGDALIAEQTQTTGSSTSSTGLSADGLAIAAQADALDLTFSDQAMLPFPVSISAGGMSADVVIPLVARDTPQEARIGLEIGQLALSDEIWSMFDAAGALDHSPADLSIDISATLDWGIDLLDIAGLSAVGQSDTPPVAPLAAQINTVTLGALGAVANATGSFTFDNSDTTTIPGMPRPEGSATITATGIFAAMDQLVAAGFLPQEQVGMARMMTGMFARSTGDDALETQIEINAEGHLIVNGQRLR